MKSVIFRPHAAVDCINQYFIPFLILRERERGVLRFVFVSKLPLLTFYFLFLMGKTNPALTLTECILHMREACFCSGPSCKGDPVTPTSPSPARPQALRWSVTAAGAQTNRKGSWEKGGKGSTGWDISSSISPLGSAPEGLGRAFLYTPTTLSLFLFVGNSEAQWPGGPQAVCPALPPGVSPPPPGCCSGSAATPSPLSSEACSALTLPMPSATRNLVPIPFPSRQAQRGGGGWTVKGVEGSVHPQSPQNKATDSIRLRFCSFSSLSSTGSRDRGGPGGERAAAPMAPLPTHLTSGLFSGILHGSHSREIDKKVPCCTWFSFSLFYF
ncbi:uncharacterized protein LOC123652079 [Pipistrellus kuhlii]|uniref:uncharacterized protein LOC123652079 n=1 Tax=Pipistrellus kuhlii TaxID=59472 RepID=UPI001E26FCBB|nr:uncharacterized protein LOC123652079 [Pipistrellus kuhlii]